jgi:hypothetical protein
MEVELIWFNQITESTSAHAYYKEQNSKFLYLLNILCSYLQYKYLFKFCKFQYNIQ